MSGRRSPLAALLLGAAVLAGCGSRGEQQAQASQAGRTTGIAEFGGPFRLVDQNGRTATERDLVGKPSPVFFSASPTARRYAPPRCNAIRRR